jgi:tetratricopeptide (TPR) repeat protein
MSQLTERPDGGSLPSSDDPLPSAAPGTREFTTPLSTSAIEPGSDAERVATLYAKARAHTDAGEDTAAVTAYRQLLKIDPRHVRARNNLALLLERRGNVQGALEELEQAIAADPDNVSLLLNRAAVLSAHLRFEQAESDLRRALRFGESAEILTSLGMVVSKGGRAKEALDPLRRAVDLDPSNAAAHYYLAEVLNRLDQLPAALVAYEQAANLQPSNWRAFKGVGNVLDRMGRPAEAAVAHRKAREAQRR